MMSLMLFLSWFFRLWRDRDVLLVEIFQPASLWVGFMIQQVWQRPGFAVAVKMDSVTVNS